jgi:type IV pilus assembly protein PilP
VKVRLLLCGLAAGVLLSGCEPQMDDLQQKVAEIKSRKSQQIEPIPAVKHFAAVTYEAGDRRDPFMPQEPEKETTTGIAGPDLNRNKEPLEEYPLDALRMVGTMQAGGTTYAMVKAPDGVIHRVAVGNYMGQNYGQIKAITESEIQVAETVDDGFGGWTPRAASVALAE